MRTPVLFGLALAQIGLFGTGPGFGQKPSRPEFEVASIKPAALDFATAQRYVTSGITVKIGKEIRGDRDEYIWMSLRQLICDAYDVNPVQLKGPDWLDSKRFDVICKRSEGSRKEDVPGMLQSLLADRFRLATHREVTEQRVSALIVGKNGAKLKETAPELPQTPGDTRQEVMEGRVKGTRQNKDVVNLGMRIGEMTVHSTMKDASKASASVHFEATNVAMARLAELLMRWNAGDGRLVVDATGLEGRYDISLDMPVSQMGGHAIAITAPSSDARESGPAEVASDPGGGSMLLRSLRNLGLDLADRKMPVVKLIIDHVERTPTEN